MSLEGLETKFIKKIDDVTVNIVTQPQCANALEIIVDNFEINTFYETIETIIHFEGSEKVCWGCGRNRCLGVTSGFKRKDGWFYYEFCEELKNTLGGESS